MNKSYDLIPLPVLRRLVLGRLGFTCHPQGTVWRLGAIVIPEETLDALSERSFAQRVRHWGRQASHRGKGEGVA